MTSSWSAYSTVRERCDEVRCAGAYQSPACRRIEKCRLVNYLQVITAQTSLFQNQRQRVDLHIQRLVESVSLIQALGGEWITSQLPTAQELRR